MQIAIDGPAGSGKSTIAKRLAKELAFTYLDTGAMYRAFAYYMLQQNKDCADLEAAKLLLKSFDLVFEQEKIFVNKQDVSQVIRTEAVSLNASKVATHQAVRTYMVKLQQEAAERIDVVMEGRDICEVVLPNADYKYFITASPEERANRRFKEQKEKGIEISYQQILEAIIERDQQDANREINPLRQAADAELIDTTTMTIDAVVAYIKEQVKNGKENHSR